MNRNLRAAIGCTAALAISFSVSWAGGQNSVTLGGIPVIVLCALFAFVVQWIVFVPSFIARTEQYFDLTGSVTYAMVVLMALLLGTSSVASALDPRSLVIASLVWIWAARLGTFLFRRVRRAGGDRRFDHIKVSLFPFLMTWTLQGMWVFLTLACALTAMTTPTPQPIGIVAVLGMAVWIAGFAIEALADAQKSQFNRDPANAGRFISCGLWAWSRHPNYFGEMVLWIGITIIAIPTLNGWQWVTLISPFFVVILLTKISGIPMLESRSDKKWGDDPVYQQYKANTPLLVLRPPRRP